MIKQLASVIGLCSTLLLTSEANAQTLPPPWQWTDVGAVGTPGEVHVGANNDWFVSGAGSNVWGTADSFVFAYQPIRDGRIFATIDSETNTNSFAKAGIMIRQTLAPGSPEVILDVKPDGGIEFMKRSSEYQTSRVFLMDYRNEPLLQMLGVRYAITYRGGARETMLAQSPATGLCESSTVHWLGRSSTPSSPSYGSPTKLAGGFVDSAMKDPRLCLNVARARPQLAIRAARTVPTSASP